MRKCLFPLLFAALLGCAGIGAGGLDPSKAFDGNPATRPTPGFTEVEVKPATSETLPAPAPFLKDLVLLDQVTQIDEVRFFTEHLQLEGGTGPVFDLEGPFVVRLIQGGNIVDEALPDFGGGVVPNGNYSRFDIGFQRLTPSLLPPEAQGDPEVLGPLMDHSMVVEGSFQGPNIAPILGIRIPFRFVSSQIAVLQVQSSDAFQLSGDFTSLFIAFKIQTWFSAAILNALNLLDPQTLLDQPLILDTQSSNPALKSIALQIEANINASLRLAPSADQIFQESDVDEASTSQVLMP